ncbi:MAG: molybdopterin-dependent oxidoreductase [Gallionella sp.]
MPASTAMPTSPAMPDSVRTTCPYCGVGCGVVLEQSADGIKVTGDRQHPANFGRLCSKGTALDQTLDSEGRLLYPIIDGERASWDAALDRVADGFRKIIAEHGPDAVALYVSGQLLTEDYYVANKLMKGFIGSANIDTNSRLCMSSAVAAHKRAFGADAVPVCYEDVELADLVVLVGSNYAWAHPVLYQRLAAAKKARPGMQVVVIDPRRTATCDIADMHLAIAPGADAFLFNGLLHHLRREDAIDLAFVEAYVEGFAAAFEAAKSVSSIPKVGQVCGLQENEVGEFFRLFAKKERTVTVFSQGINQSSSGVDKGNAIINVHLATGRIGKAGMGPFSVTGQPNAMGGREVGGLANQLAAHMDFADAASVDRVQRFWNAPNIARAPGLKVVDMFRAIAEKKIRAVWIMGTNPAVSMPDADRVRDALQGCELVVVSDCVRHTDTTACADILLPACGWGEKDGTVTNSERRISRQRAFLPATGEAKPDWWIVTQVAQRMGYTEAFPYDKPAQIFREHARLSGFENGAGFENGLGFENDGAVHRKNAVSKNKASQTRFPLPSLLPWPSSTSSYRNRESAARGARSVGSVNESPREPVVNRAFDIGALSDIDNAQYDALQPVQWPVNDQNPGGTQRLFTDGKFYTPGGKARMIAVAAQLPALETDTGFPLVLNTGRLRDQWHTMTRTAKVPRLNSHSYEPCVEIHSRDAQRLQLQDGGLARLSSRNGSMLARVQVSDEQRIGSVFVPMHWNDTFARSARVDALTAAITDPISGQPELKHTPVYVEPYKAAWQGFVLSRERLALPEADYCACTQGAGYWRHEIAGDALPEDSRTWVQAALGKNGDWSEYRDDAMGRYRAACIRDGRLEAVFFIAPDQRLPAREWLASLFSQEAIAPAELAGLLTARPPKGSAANTGRNVCACFSVGENTILHAIREQGVDSVEAVGTCLKAGTNCGSCVPELRRLIEQNAPVAIETL